MEKKITYTESGKAELEKYIDKKKRALEQRIIEQKYVFGDDEIEITGVDVRHATEFNAQKIVLERRRPLVRYLLEVYFVVGLILFVIGLFYSNLSYLIEDIISGNPIRALFILTGATLIVASVFLRLLFARKNMRKERNITNI